MKLTHCSRHQPPNNVTDTCLIIRHDNFDVATHQQIWAELERLNKGKEDALYRSYTIEKQAYYALHAQLNKLELLNFRAVIVLAISAAVNIGLAAKELYQL